MPSVVTQLATPAERHSASDVFSSPRIRTAIVALSLVLLTLLVYHPVGKNSFTNFDDVQYIIQNPHVNSGLHWETIKWAFTTYYAANWHPLTWLSHAVDCSVFGLNPAGHHGVSALLQALNAVLLFAVLQNITGASWRSLLVGVLFSVHPLNVESVAWAAERKTLLSTSLFLLATWAYARYARTPSLARYSAVLGLFAMALMAKPQVITFPFILLLLDYWPLRRTSAAASTRGLFSQSHRYRWLILEKIPLFLLSALSALITLRAQRIGDAVRSTIECPFGLRIENAVVSYVCYLRDVLFPRHLAPIYPYPEEFFRPWKLALAVLILVCISVLVFLRRKSSSYLVVGWLWFLGMLIPMIGLVQVGVQARADRYMYLSGVGLFIVAVWGMGDLLEHFRIRLLWRVAPCAAAIIILSISTYSQVKLWRTSETLWNYTLSVTKRNYKAEDNLAQYLAAQGRTAEAIVHFHNILPLHNWQPLDLIAFGTYERRYGYVSDALQQYETALEKSTDAKTRAMALSNIGYAYLDLNQKELARKSFEQALHLNPNDAQSLIGSGAIAQNAGSINLAYKQYMKALSIERSNLAYLLIARILKQSGRVVDARAAYESARQISPDMRDTCALADHLVGAMNCSID
jgi:tetratricopeptide (TPR) repeat protein